MRTRRNIIIGIGEVLWDVLPGGKQLGGAPANFAYHAAMLGNFGIPVSRIGNDDPGKEIKDLLQNLNLDITGLQVDPGHPTGTVNVEIDARGQPGYRIIENVAWDHLEWTDQLKQIAKKADAVCFGSLAQRSVGSREVIRKFLGMTKTEAIRMFDINIRQHYYTRETIEASLALANIIKLNDAELEHIARMLGLGERGDLDAAQALLRRYRLDLVCVTRGAEGSWLISPDACDIHPGIKVKVADTVGAGDAFAAAICHHRLKKSDLAMTNRAANILGAWVASRSGATPKLDSKILDEVA